MSAEPLTVEKTKEVSGEGKELILEGISALKEQYGSHKGVQLVEIAGGLQLVTRPEAAPWIKKYLTVKTTGRLSQAGLETLSIVAYKQPITRDDVEQIRGVDCGGVLRTLLERRMLRLLGRKSDHPGMPFLYGTSKEFLNYFGLKGLPDLPPLNQFPSEDLVPQEEKNSFFAESVRDGA